MISVIVCSYNRCRSLSKTLASLMETRVPSALSWELIVVDNNSTDDTKQVVADFARRAAFDVRYVFEGKQGLSHARNRGVEEARGDIIAFTDDDVIVERDWLGNMTKAFADYDAASVGGKILPLWENPPPPWLTHDLYNCLALLDYGDSPLFLDSPWLCGANFAVKAFAFQKYGAFNGALGRVPGKLSGAEETEFFRRLLSGGERLLYHPDVRVRHLVPESRLTRAYLRKWSVDQGVSNGIALGPCSSRNVAGIPLFILRELAESALCYGKALLLNGDDKFSRELRLRSRVGFIRGRLQLRSAQNSSALKRT